MAKADETQMQPSDVFGARLREIREGRGFTQLELAARLEAKGRPMNKAAILRIEKGVRGVSLDEAFALAAVLVVAPAHLLSPPDGEHVWLTGNMAVNGAEMRNWFLFGDPLLISPEGRRVSARMDLVFTIEALAQAIVDAKRGGDSAGSQTAIRELMQAIAAHQQTIGEIGDEGGEEAS